MNVHLVIHPAKGIFDDKNWSDTPTLLVHLTCISGGSGHNVTLSFILAESSKSSYFLPYFMVTFAFDVTFMLK